MKKIVSKFFPEEIIGLLMISVLLILSLLYNKHISYSRITGRHYFYFFSYTVLFFILFGGKFKSIGKIIRNFFPLILVTTVFENLGDIVSKINPNLFDHYLIDIDKIIFGGDPSLWMQRFYTPWLTNLMHSAYTSYYLIPPLVAMVLYISGSYKGFRDFAVAASLTAFIGYLGYVLIPAIGPKYVLAHLYTVDLKSGKLMAKMMEVIHNYEPFRRDCFPSLHTAHTVVSMVFVWRYLKKIFSIPLIIWGSLLIISTMYGRHHYGIDVIAGILLAIFTIYISPRINRWWYKTIMQDDWKIHYPTRLRYGRFFLK